MEGRMGISTAKWLAPGSFLLNFCAQIYGMGISEPNMKQIHDRNLSFFSPQPMFIAAFFFPQQLVQLGWLWRLWKLSHAEMDNGGGGGGAAAASRDSGAERELNRELGQMIDYVPWYSLGNLCIGAWMLAWNSSQLGIAQGFVTVNTLAQLYFMIAKLPPMDTHSSSSILTHIVSKTFAGIGVLDFLHNGSIAFFKDQAAITTIKVLTGLGFGMASAAGDWIFGSCMVYDLVALAVGQWGGSWGNLLAIYAVGAAGIVTVKSLAS